MMPGMSRCSAVQLRQGKFSWNTLRLSYFYRVQGRFAKPQLEHVFSIDPENLKAYYYLLQIAHMILQLVEAGSLLRNLAAEFGRTPMQLFGSLKNLARRMLEAFRYMILNDQAFDPLHAASIQIRLDSS